MTGAAIPHAEAFHVAGALDDEAVDDSVSAVLEAARDHLGMEVAFIAATDSAPARRAAADLDVTHGSPLDRCISVPLELSDGRVFGRLRCHRGGERGNTMGSLRMLAELISGQLERRSLDREAWRCKIRSTGVQALLAALEARDVYTKEHSEAVVRLSAATGRALGLPAHVVDEVKQVGLLHDLGKLAVPDPILTKEQTLTEEEWASVKQHTVVGARIVASVEGLRHLAPAIRAAHERWDGSGYPDGLVGRQIPLASRIVSLCDAYHAMVSPRPYRGALDPWRAALEIARGAGSQFCPRAAAGLLAAS